MIEKLMRGRRSIRRYKPQKVPRELIEKLIEMAVTAPSASNKQPWRFFITENREIIDRMASAVRAAVERIARHVEPDFKNAFLAYGDYFIRFSNAPLVIVPVYQEMLTLSHMVDKELPADDLARIREMELNSGLVSVSLAIQNLMIYAHSIGLGTSCMTGPMVALDAIKSALGIPESWKIAAVVAAGYPDETPPALARKPGPSVIRWVGNNNNGNSEVL